MQIRRNTPWAALCLLAASTAWAHQPSPVEVTIESILARYGDSFLRLTNNTRETQVLSLSPGSAGTANFRPVREMALSPNTPVTINLGDLNWTDGIQILHVTSTVSLPGGGTTPGPQLH